MIYSECRVIPAPDLSKHEMRGLAKGLTVDVDDVRKYRMGDAFELTVDGEAFWVMCRFEGYRVSFRRMDDKEKRYAAKHGHPIKEFIDWKEKTTFIPPKGDTLYIDVESCGLTLSEALAEIERLKAEHPDEEIFLSGDYYAICGRKRTAPRRTRFKGVWA